MEKNNENKLDPKKNTLDSSGKIRFDYLFSYWVLLWFIIYYSIDVSSKNKYIMLFKQNFNPLFALWFALSENIITFIFILIVKPEIVLLIKYLFMMCLIKILPIYLLRKTQIKLPNDIIVLSVVFFIYNIYLLYNNTNLYLIYSRTFTAFMKNEDITPIFSFIENVFKKLHLK